MGLTPIDDVVIVVAARNRAADHQKQHLAQRICDFPRLPSILDGRQVVEQHPAVAVWLTRFPSDSSRIGRSEGISSASLAKEAMSPRQAKNRVNLTTSPCE